MTTVVVLDPSIANGVADESGLELLQEWVTDRRVRLGHRAWTRLATGYGQQTLGTPRELAQIAHRVIGDLLTREPLVHDVVMSAATINPPYLGSIENQQDLIDDLKGLGDADETVLGTHPSLWSGDAAAVQCDPPPPSNLESHYAPNLPTPEELRARAVKWFDGRRILIVGGQVDKAVIAGLETSFGITGDAVHWIPSEKNKRARNLRKVIGGLPANAIAVCVVGKVGHDVSGEVKDYCGRRSITLVESRFGSQIVDDLHGLVV